MKFAMDAARFEERYRIVAMQYSIATVNRVSRSPGPARTWKPRGASKFHPAKLPRGHDLWRVTGSMTSVSRASKLFSQGAFYSGEKRNAGSTKAGSSRLLSVKLTLVPVMFR